MNHHIRYWLFQIPGLVLSVLVGGSLYYFGRITLQTAYIIFGAWVLKDLITYPILVHSFRIDKANTGIEKMVGMVGVVKQSLQPEGIVWIRGERWMAVSMEEEEIAQGVKVQVKRVDQLTLFVIPHELSSEEDH